MAYSQAVLLYLPSDGAADYLRRLREEADAISGRFAIFLPDEIRDGDLACIEKLFDSKAGRERYPGLKRTDLPCLWLEGEAGTAVLRLPQQASDIRAYFAAVADAAPLAVSAKDLKQRVKKALVTDRKDRLIELEILQKGSPGMKRSDIVWGAVCGLVFVCLIFVTGVFYPGPATDKAIAEVCGVVFVAAILIIAVAAPNPTSSQERVFRIVLSIAAAGFVSMTPGFLEVTIEKWVRAGGALAVFVLVYFYNPASLIVDRKAGRTER